MTPINSHLWALETWSSAHFSLPIEHLGWVPCLRRELCLFAQNTVQSRIDHLLRHFLSVDWVRYLARRTTFARVPLGHQSERGAMHLLKDSEKALIIGNCSECRHSSTAIGEIVYGNIYIQGFCVAAPQSRSIVGWEKKSPAEPLPLHKCFIKHEF